MTQVIFSLLAGVAGALLFAMIPNGGMLAVAGVNFSAAPLFAAGLAFGPSYAFVAAVVGVAFLHFGLAEMAGIELRFGQENMVIAYAVLEILPVLVISRIYLTKKKSKGKDGKYITIWTSVGTVLSAAALITLLLMVAGAIAVGFTAGLYTNSYGETDLTLMFKEETPFKDLCASVITQFSGNLSAALESMGKGEALKFLNAFMNSLSLTFPSFVAILLLVHTLIGGAVGMGITNKLGKSLRPMPKFNPLMLPEWAAGLLILALVMGLFSGGDAGFLGINAALITCLPFMFKGLSTTTNYLLSLPLGKLWVMLLSLSFIISVIWVPLALALVGLVEHFMKHRPKGDVLEIKNGSNPA